MLEHMNHRESSPIRPAKRCKASLDLFRFIWILDFKFSEFFVVFENLLLLLIRYRKAGKMLAAHFVSIFRTLN